MREQLDAVNLDLVLRNKDLLARLTDINFTQWGLFVPMIADLLGVIFIFAGLVAFPISWWCWVGLSSMLAYELVMFGLVIGAIVPARKRARAADDTNRADPRPPERNV
jgi:hypothetical protein